MALIIMVIVALAWSAWLLYDGIRECRKIDREKQVVSGGVMSGGVNSPTPSLTHSRLPSLADCLEVR